MHQSTSLSDYLTQCWGTRKVLIQHTLELNLMPFGSELNNHAPFPSAAKAWKGQAGGGPKSALNKKVRADPTSPPTGKFPWAAHGYAVGHLSHNLPFARH